MLSNPIKVDNEKLIRQSIDINFRYKKNINLVMDREIGTKIFSDHTKKKNIWNQCHSVRNSYQDYTFKHISSVGKTPF